MDCAPVLRGRNLSLYIEFFLYIYNNVGLCLPCIEVFPRKLVLRAHFLTHRLCK